MRSLHTETSKLLNDVLRHAPQSIGLTLDREGWADIAALIAAAAAAGRARDADLIRAVASSNDKQRVALSADGRQIRAVQGHSTATVALAHVARMPPSMPYPGTATGFLEAILVQGLQPGQRHHVDLSADPQTAATVGARHGAPGALRVHSLQMHEDGDVFYQADNGIWLTSRVPPNYLHLVE
ncbi:RNA 2'-phosphotransferase [Xanthomonas citri pv. fuscans CFBP 6996]|uniref:RNA 2'-phosphotransferase n=1 Tax=Xanthomonas citri TaxID=346 RepID=UPI000C1A8468|nr:RNA 2'-phosphotransferase [Xanthomonas citri]ATS53406.1 RNA 2'-phosphotransferase [Xanthomonas citri pv. phaseoli var. fuscans]ATS57690.1 RNA 2'-phosphotransferase [Xanthomonas citri pv. phaseoli var. fuscans]ATS61856.1 RNA 2'-phosphotransferase [Xanthomonas citri pv. phaseoli var. fuscans]PTY29016.1 RNA 2'-phosphotransferase [Xanthomonas citri pv. fuscans CFBP 6996]QWN18694.1 RNA 2'-phosphotransferase [Xanthomonas citri]